MFRMEAQEGMYGDYGQRYMIKDFAADHVISGSRGGSVTDENLQLLFWALQIELKETGRGNI